MGRHWSSAGCSVKSRHTATLSRRALERRCSLSAGRKRRADAGFGFDEINRLLQDGRFSEHGVNTRFAQEISRISGHLHLEHHVVVGNKYLGMGLVAGCNIKRGMRRSPGTEECVVVASLSVPEEPPSPGFSDAKARTRSSTASNLRSCHRRCGVRS